MNEAGVKIAGIIAGGAVVLSIVTGITVGTINSRDAAEHERVTCIENGGTAVVSYDDITCIGGSDE